MNKETKRIIIQVLLFIATLITTTLAGAELSYGKSIFGVTENGFGINPQYSWSDFFSGMDFSFPFLLILTVHEFGHYFTALHNKIETSLPYYIPIPPGLLFLSIGTLGAVIRIRTYISSNIKHFDIGIAGPLAGFIVALIVLVYGFRTLPPAEYVYLFHPEYKQYGLNYADHVYSDEYLKKENGVIDVEFGSSLLFEFFSKFIAAHPDRVPNAHELMHYPVLMAGFIALFITSLNLLPIGQLDGGHVVYGLFGRKGHRTIASIFFIALCFYAGLGYVDIRAEKDSLVWLIPIGILFYYLCLSGLRMPARDTWMYTLLIVSIQLLFAWFLPTVKGYSGWMVFAILLGRVLGVQHPPTEIEEPLDTKRQVLGWLCLLVFITCFSLKPLQVHTVFPDPPQEKTEPIKTT